MKITILTVLLFLSLNCLNGQEGVMDDVVCSIFAYKSKQAKEICEAFIELKKIYKYKKYADQVEQDLKSRREISSPPSNLVGNKTMKQGLNHTQKKLAIIKIPIEIGMEEPKFPTIEEFTHSDFTIKRKAINQAVEYNLIHQTKIQNFHKLKADLNAFRKEAKKVKIITHEMQKNLIEASAKTGGGLTQLSTIFGTAALDLETEIIPKIADIIRVLNEKIKELDKLTSKESQKFESMNSNLRLQIKAEREELNKEIKAVETELEITLQRESRILKNRNELLKQGKIYERKRHEMVSRGKKIKEDLKKLREEIKEHKKSKEYEKKKREVLKRKDLFITESKKNRKLYQKNIDAVKVNNNKLEIIEIQKEKLKKKEETLNTLLNLSNSNFLN